MFEKFMSVNARDFSQRYQGTYGFFSRDGRKTLVQLSHVDHERGVITFIDQNKAEYRLNKDSTDNVGFEFLPPKSEWHNTSMGALLVRRVPARQYSRGICDQNTSIQDSDGRAKHISFPALLAIFESKETAISSERVGRSFAISPQFCVIPAFRSVNLFNQPIGYYTKEGAEYEVKLTNPELFQVEVSDAFRRSEISAKIQ